MMVLWKEVTKHNRQVIENPEAHFPNANRLVTLRPTGKFFFIDTRGKRWHKSSGYNENALCIHNGTTAVGTLDRYIANIERWNREFPGTRHDHWIVVEALNATQVAHWLKGNAFISPNFHISGGNMPSKATIDAQIAALNAEVVRLTMEAARLEKRPKEPQFDNDAEVAPNIVGFQKRFQPHGRVYQFAAIQVAENEWYLTGRNQVSKTWEELLDYIDAEGTNTPDNLRVMTVHSYLTQD